LAPTEAQKVELHPWSHVPNHLSECTALETGRVSNEKGVNMYWYFTMYCLISTANWICRRLIRPREKELRSWTQNNRDGTAFERFRKVKVIL
jgi:hypothetical protein